MFNGRLMEERTRSPNLIESSTLFYRGEVGGSEIQISKVFGKQMKATNSISCSSSVASVARASSVVSAVCIVRCMLNRRYKLLCVVCRPVIFNVQLHTCSRVKSFLWITVVTVDLQWFIFLLQNVISKVQRVNFHPCLRPVSSR